MARSYRWKAWLAAGLAVLVVLGVALGVFWDDVMRTGLDPKAPFQTYQPPPAPDYARPQAWALLPPDPQSPGPEESKVDVFFISPTTFDGGRDWNAPIGDREADKLFRRVMAPNYAGPFVRVGRIFAPRYRQASLYTQLTLREDATEARRFAYADVARAFRTFAAYDRDRPFVLVGVEQGGLLGARLLAEVIMPDPDLRRRLAAAYLQETVVSAANPPAPPCLARGQTGCVAAWMSVRDVDVDIGREKLDRALAWNSAGELVHFSGPALCFNPVLGEVSERRAAARLALGAANATGLEWGARPAFLPRQVSAHCAGGLLRVSKPKSSSLKRSGDWAAHRRVPDFNLFWADMEADALGRVAALGALP